MTKSILLFSSAALMACGTQESINPLCVDGAHDIIVEVLDVPQADRWIAQDLVLTGTTNSSRPIQSIRILDQEAQSTDHNFATWTLTLPIETLRARGTGDTSLDVHVWSPAPPDVCDEAQVADTAPPLEEGRTESGYPATLYVRGQKAKTIDVRVMPADGIPVDDLILLQDDLPWCHLPKSGGLPVAMDVCAPAAAAGADVEIQASNGSFTGLSGKNARLTASSSGCPSEDTAMASWGAHARFFFSPSDAGWVQFTATAPPSLSQVGDLFVADAPSWSSTSLTMGAAQSRATFLDVPGRLASCRVIQSEPGDLATLTLDGEELIDQLSWTPPDESLLGCPNRFVSEPSRVLQVTSSDTVVGSSVLVRCVDVHGQWTQDLNISLSGG